MKMFLLLLVLCLGCKAPVKLVDHTRVNAEADSLGTSKRIERIDTSFVRMLTSGMEQEIVIRHYALLPDSVRLGAEQMTYLYKEERRKESARQDLAEIKKGEGQRISQDSSHVTIKDEVQKAIDYKERKSNIELWVIFVVLIGGWVLVIVFRRKLL